jgi:hypothetical protein
MSRFNCFVSSAPDSAGDYIISFVAQLRMVDLYILNGGLETWFPYVNGFDCPGTCRRCSTHRKG